MKSLRDFASFFLLATCTSIFAAQPTYARTLSRADLKDLASEFVHRMKAPQKTQKQKQNNLSPSTQLNFIPDGEQLLFRPKVGNIVYDLDMLALKQSNGVYVSFYDIISVFEFPITYDEDTHTAFGWFLREDWGFQLNLENKEVSSKGKEFRIFDKDILIEGGELYVHKDALEQWFDMTYDLDIAQQYIDVKSPFPLPKIAQHYRRLREDQKIRLSKTARLPRKNVEYDMLDLNLADLNLRSSYRKTTPSQPKPFRQRANVALEGELLNHSAYVLANADSELGLDSVVARLKKESEDPTLLGPLKARSYTVGDSPTTRLPLTGDATQELGVNVSNNPLSNSNFETTEIEGDGLPGWDVELYRNGSLVASLEIDETGRYRFENIQLFGGDNIFELFFYGPQGEIRSDNVNIPVSQALLSTQNNTYEFSATLSDERTYRQRESGDLDAGKPHIAGRYNFFLGDVLSYTGFRARQVEGKEKLFLGAGATKIIRNAIIGANFGLDNDGETATELTARTKIKGWNLFASGDIRSDNYVTDSTQDVEILQTSLSANKTYKPLIGTRGNIAANILHTETAGGRKIDRQTLNVSNSFGRLNLSNALQHLTLTGEADRLENTVSARYQYGKLFTRHGVDYDIKPKKKIDRYFSQYSYRPTNKFITDLRLDYEPDRDFSEARLNVTYIHDNVRISPFLEVDSDDEIFAGLNLNSTLVNDESLDRPLLTSEKLVGRGLVSSFVYHDKNGDLVFNGEDEPLSDVIVESVNVKRRAQTNEKGYSLLKSLPTTRATDIRVDRNTLPDPFMISATQGHSIFPRGGDIVNMEFPIHVAGEVDGIVSIQKKNGKETLARLLRVQLIPTSGDLTKVQTAKTAGDGFFVFSQVPPGEYLLTPSYDDLKKLNIGQPAPELVSIGYDGTVLYGKKIQLSEALPPTRLKMKEGGSNSYVLNIENKGQSRLSGLLHKVMQRQHSSSVLNTLKRIMMKDANNQEIERYVAPSGTLKESFDLCQKLIQDKNPCEIEQAMVVE